MGEEKQSIGCERRKWFWQMWEQVRRDCFQLFLLNSNSVALITFQVNRYHASCRIKQDFSESSRRSASQLHACELGKQEWKMFCIIWNEQLFPLFESFWIFFCFYIICARKSIAETVQKKVGLRIKSKLKLSRQTDWILKFCRKTIRDWDQRRKLR